MGLTIHYRGAIGDTALIPALVEEVRDISTTLGWTITEIDDEDYRGCICAPQNCEPVNLLFRASDGVLESPWLVPYEGWVFTKTQYAGMEAHIAVVDLLRYLTEKYFARFEMTDEGGYWESRNKDVLRTAFARYEVLLEMVTGALEGFKAVEGETPEGLAARMESMIKERLGVEGGVDIRIVRNGEGDADGSE